MTASQQTNIRKLRAEGYGYKKIASELNLPLGTVKTFCRRNNITSDGNTNHCIECGTEIIQSGPGRPRKFCSEKCKQHYWNTHIRQLNMKKGRKHICACCGKEFTTYRDNSRFCSTDCYMAYRFGGVHYEEKQI